MLNVLGFLGKIFWKKKKKTFLALLWMQRTRTPSIYMMYLCSFTSLRRKNLSTGMGREFGTKLKNLFLMDTLYFEYNKYVLRYPIKSALWDLNLFWKVFLLPKCSHLKFDFFDENVIFSGKKMFFLRHLFQMSSKKSFFLKLDMLTQRPPQTFS